MKAWTHEIGDILLVSHEDREVPALVAGYLNSLDDATPLYVRLRNKDNTRWKANIEDIYQEQIIRALPEYNFGVPDQQERRARRNLGQDGQWNGFDITKKKRDDRVLPER